MIKFLKSIFSFKERRYKKHKKIFKELCKKYQIEQVDDCDWKYMKNIEAQPHTFLALDRNYGRFTIATKWDYIRYSGGICSVFFPKKDELYLYCEYNDYTTTDPKKIEQLIVESLYSLKQAKMNFKLKQMEGDF